MLAVFVGVLDGLDTEVRSVSSGISIWT